MNRREKLVDLIWENFATLPSCDFEKTIDAIEELYQSTDCDLDETQAVRQNEDVEVVCKHESYEKIYENNEYVKTICCKCGKPW